MMVCLSSFGPRRSSLTDVSLEDLRRASNWGSYPLSVGAEFGASITDPVCFLSIFYRMFSKIEENYAV